MFLIIFTISFLIFIHLFYSVVEFKLGLKRIYNLSDQKTLSLNQLPLVSIIVSALNEEKIIEESINSLLNLDYPRLEIIAINDRSTDATFEILEKLKKQSSSLQVYHIDKLPEGWLGKNHALHVASQKASGEWLLFTDADVIMKNTIISKAVSYALTHQIDHLTIHEHHVRKRFGLKVLMLGCYMTYCMFMKPWRIRYAWSKKYLGHGAFNLVRKNAYFSSGGHRAIAMECLDDLMLGKLLKQNGHKQDIVDGTQLIQREWYVSAWAMINGLNKNSFAFFNFNLSRVFCDSIFALIYYFWPITAVFFFSGLLKWMNVISIIMMFYFALSVAKQFRLHTSFALLYPASICMLVYTIWHSVFYTYKHNGILWRDTHYSLAKLRSKKPIMQEE